MNNSLMSRGLLQNLDYVLFGYGGFKWVALKDTGEWLPFFMWLFTFVIRTSFEIKV